MCVCVVCGCYGPCSGISWNGSPQRLEAICVEAVCGVRCGRLKRIQLLVGSGRLFLLFDFPARRGAGNACFAQKTDLKSDLGLRRTQRHSSVAPSGYGGAVHLSPPVCLSVCLCAPHRLRPAVHALAVLQRQPSGQPSGPASTPHRTPPPTQTHDATEGGPALPLFRLWAASRSALCARRKEVCILRCQGAAPRGDGARRKRPAVWRCAGRANAQRLAD